ncbi:MAG: hypothetical protein KF773_26630 [Deltaproteobacteria bacterium]|nr:hypothetical protein [Deltaproteobacteria bacterium]
MRRALLALLPLLALPAACGGDPDPCAGAKSACIALRVASRTVEAIDLLELDIVYGDRHDTAVTALADNGVVGLPIITAVALDVAGATRVGVVAAGKLSGNVLGIGAATTTLDANQRVELDLVLAPRSTCQTGGDYCGGDELAGSEDTLYRCTDGVPVARGRCVHGCVVRDGIDDGCDGGPERCVEGGLYCGGNKVVGDPRSLYRCTNGRGAARMMCADGCMILPSPNDDRCR